MRDIPIRSVYTSPAIFRVGEVYGTQGVPEMSSGFASFIVYDDEQIQGMAQRCLQDMRISARASHLCEQPDLSGEDGSKFSEMAKSQPRAGGDPSAERRHQIQVRPHARSVRDTAGRARQCVRSLWCHRAWSQAQQWPTGAATRRILCELADRSLPRDGHRSWVVVPRLQCSGRRLRNLASNNRARPVNRIPEARLAGGER
jgi:hypothetical protein